MNRSVIAVLFAIGLVFSSAACRRSNGTLIHASGHIEATEVRLAAKVGGPLILLPFWEGDRVNAGDTVARFDVSDAEHDLARAKAELDEADARLRLLLAGTRREDLERAAAELAGAKADLAAAVLDLSRLEGLADRGTATLKARDDARTHTEVLGYVVAADRAELAKLTAGARPQEIEQALAQKQAMQAAVATISQRISDATVIAPRDGVITARATEPGEVLPPGATLYVLADIAHPWLTVYVDEPSLGRVHLGDAVEVRVDGRSESFTGKVTFISPVAEFTPKNVQTPEERAKLVFRVKIGLDNPAGIFKPGMPADAWFTATSDRVGWTARTTPFPMPGCGQKSTDHGAPRAESAAPARAA